MPQRCLLDTNILIRWMQPENVDYSIVKAAVTALIRREIILCYTSQNLAEFWNACTRPLERNGYGLSPEATNHLALQFETRLKLLPDTPQIHEEWRALLVRHGVRGAQVHDTRIAAAMIVHHVEQLLTFNTKDFARFSGLVVSHPNDVLLQARLSTSE